MPKKRSDSELLITRAKQIAKKDRFLTLSDLTKMFNFSPDAGRHLIKQLKASTFIKCEVNEVQIRTNGAKRREVKVISVGKPIVFPGGPVKRPFMSLANQWLCGAVGKGVSKHG